MELEFIEKAKNRAVLKIHGEDHTLLNPLVKTLQKNANVKVAAYNIDHPLERVPHMIVETKIGTGAIDALKNAVKELKVQNAAFLKEFKKAVK